MAVKARNRFLKSKKVMVSPSATETTLAGQEKQVAGMVSKKNRKVRREQRTRVSLDEW